MTSPTGSQTGRFGYGGEYGYQEDEVGLKQLGHRLYDAVVGGFTKGIRIDIVATEMLTAIGARTIGVIRKERLWYSLLP